MNKGTHVCSLAYVATMTPSIDTVEELVDPPRDRCYLQDHQVNIKEKAWKEKEQSHHI